MGPIGHFKLQAARLRNPRLLTGLDLRKKRLELGRRLGADLVLNPRETDVVDEVRNLTGGYGCRDFPISMNS